MSDIAAWLSAIRAADRDTVHVMATVSHVLPWWGSTAAAIVRAGPIIALFLWLLNFLLATPEASQARAAQVRSLVAGLFLGAAWAVAWAAGPLGTYTGFAASPAAQAAASALPLGAALLALGVGDGGGPLGALLRVVVVAYALSRLAIGADGPLRVVAEAVSAVAASLLVARVGALRTPLDNAAAGIGRALGLGARPIAAIGRR
jgi:hypothetical protein